jgi:hypothetical protein
MLPYNDRQRLRLGDVAVFEKRPALNRCPNRITDDEDNN